jgi:hypothetical protein
MKYAFEMVSDAMIHIPSFMKIGSVIRKLLWWIHIQTQVHKEQSALISLLFSFWNMKVGLCYLRAVCVFVYSHRLLNGCTSLYETWYVYNCT